MPEYFKFCPKCGRVLNRDWCTYCEPEKEEAYRKEQLKRYRIQGDYVSDTGIDHDIHSGIGGIFDAIRNIFTKENVHEKSVNSGEFVDSVLREQKKAERKNRGIKRKRNPVKWVVVLLFVINLVPTLFGFVFGLVRSSGQVPKEIMHYIDRVEDFFAGSVETVWLDGEFDDLRDLDDSYEDDRLDVPYSLRTYQEGDTFEWDHNGTYLTSSYYYSVFADQDDIMGTKGFGKEMLKIAAEAKKKAEACQNTGQEYGFNQYLTYFDKSYSAIIHKEYDNDNPRIIHSYLVDNNTLETIDLDEKIHLDEMGSDLIERMGEATGVEFTKQKYEELITLHHYYYAVDGNGEIYIGFTDDGSNYHVQLGVKLQDVLE